MREEIITRSAAATKRYAAKLVRKLGAIHVIALEGCLGAGKTVFVKGIAKGLGVKHLIQSPTFVIMRVYPVKHRSIRTLVHVDCYRLKDSRELMDIGLQDYLEDPSTLTVIEWADRVPELIPVGALTVAFQRTGANDKRKLIVSSRAVA